MNAAGSISRVEPIRDKQQIEDMKEHLLQNNERDYLLFVLGINSGLRISDLLKLTVEDVISGKVSIREQKTKKAKTFILSDACMKAINDYLAHTKITTGTLFPSKKDKTKPITKQHAWHVLNKAAEFVEITENIGTHTMRKTFGYHAFKSGVDIYYIMQCLNHSSPAITKRYIGIEQQELDEVVYSKMNL